MHPTLSVIIPVYNVAATLRRCIDSVLAQGVNGIEIILVDDGSTDDSPSICDAYGKRDGITVVHRQNGGLSAARNTGIERASGQYLTFVDSDDYVESDTYRQLLSLMTDCDIVEFPVERELWQGPVSLSFGNRTYTDCRAYWLEGKAYAHTYACNKIYRRELFNGVRYPEGRVFEDVPTLWQLLKRAQVVRTVDVGCYHYTLNPGGITQQADGHALRQLLETHVGILGDKQLQGSEGYQLYYRHVLNIQISVYDQTDDDYDLILPVMPFWRSLKLIALHLFGLRGLCRLHRAFFY